MTDKLKKPELLAPAGNFEKMKTALAFGADAVYLGIPDFSLRVRVNDFTMPEIKRAVEYAHGLKKKVYVTVNIFAHNEHLEKLPAHLSKLKAIGPDGIFVSDPGILEEVKRAWPGVKLILSTQANCTNWRSAKFWQKAGCKRIILARELGLKEIKEIRAQAPKLELEVFAHGALCMAYSGRCFLSKYYNDRNANLGDCSQPCRWEYRTTLIKPDGHEAVELGEEEHGSYILNSEDLCLLKRLPELIDAGISALKIEGRAKSVYYLANVVGAYRRAIDLICEERPAKHGKRVKDELEFLYQELETKTFNRGFTEGFMFGAGEGAQNLANSHNYPDWEFCGETVKCAKMKNGKFRAYVKVHNTLKIGDQVEIIRPNYDIIKMKVVAMTDVKTGQSLSEAHGGTVATVIIMESDADIPVYSVWRRLIKQ
ncbi:MAG: U32 family peptidase C-terminal domain-containing protein [Candidatus Falkowbacteria bacterium]